MHAYIYEPGEEGLGGHISSEVWVPDSEWLRLAEQDADRRSAIDRPVPGGATVLTRPELLADSATRQALLAWEAHDDAQAEMAHELRQLHSA
jgi:hypothetical protein